MIPSENVVTDRKITFFSNLFAYLFSIPLYVLTYYSSKRWLELALTERVALKDKPQVLKLQHAAKEHQADYMTFFDVGYSFGGVLDYPLQMALKPMFFLADLTLGKTRTNLFVEQAKHKSRNFADTMLSTLQRALSLVNDLSPYTMALISLSHRVLFPAAWPVTLLCYGLTIYLGYESYMINKSFAKLAKESRVNPEDQGGVDIKSYIDVSAIHRPGKYSDDALNEQAARVVAELEQKDAYCSDFIAKNAPEFEPEETEDVGDEKGFIFNIGHDLAAGFREAFDESDFIKNKTISKKKKPQAEPNKKTPQFTQAYSLKPFWELEENTTQNQPEARRNTPRI